MATVAELRAALRKRGLSATGSKAELEARLQEAEEEEEAATARGAATTATPPSTPPPVMGPPGARPTRRRAAASAKDTSAGAAAGAAAAAAAAATDETCSEEAEMASVVGATPAARRSAAKWGAAADAELRRLFALYTKDGRLTEGAVHLVHAMVERHEAAPPGRLTVEDCGRRLLELRAVTADGLFQLLPALEGEDPWYETQLFKASLKSPEARLTLAANVAAREMPTQATALFQLLKSKLDECTTFRGISGLSLASSPDDPAGDARGKKEEQEEAHEDHTLFLTTDDERRVVQTRWAPKLLKALGMTPVADQPDCWIIPGSMPTATLEKYATSMDTASKRTAAADAKRHEAAVAERERIARAQRARAAQEAQFAHKAPNPDKIFGTGSSSSSSSSSSKNASAQKADSENAGQKKQEPVVATATSRRSTRRR